MISVPTERFVENLKQTSALFYLRKQSGSYKGFICAKAKRQQQMFYLCESEATATKQVARSGNQSLRIN
ncbi:hypothetical protein AMS59_16400 [Lysinibacillus sp. FJAT-14745]|nr:hypothetical protein AMS59_16400 [Lysinibacillus sp. FJAT-14745]